MKVLIVEMASQVENQTQKVLETCGRGRKANSSRDVLPIINGKVAKLEVTVGDMQENT